MTGRIDSALVGIAAVCGLAAGVAWGCKTSEPETEVVVPSAATQAPEYEGDGSVPEQRYVVRMSDGERDWEVQFPEVATGYEMKIPLEDEEPDGPLESVEWDSDNLTEADKELLEELRRRRGDMEREGLYVGGQNVHDEAADEGIGASGDGDESPEEQQESGASEQDSESEGEAGSDGASEEGGDGEQGGEAKKAPTRPSYLLGIEEVRKLYRAGKYELAMVKLKKLEKAYPNDVKLLSMEGTLWRRLGEENLARKAWDRVLQIDPDNEQVREAQQRLNDSE